MAALRPFTDGEPPTAILAGGGKVEVAPLPPPHQQNTAQRITSCDSAWRCSVGGVVSAEKPPWLPSPPRRSSDQGRCPREFLVLLDAGQSSEDSEVAGPWGKRRWSSVFRSGETGR
ncbi:hypothetical protein NDU88_005773 [Pleurodeles waltl]|uniref:Uncharacterized protein n=1 Tax=Pleurodeles waltl TaxID=8319 RepID=A0AAV7MB02_PLEWA|nr:hypothetical protein NDU88_005773 [Pleurodeles waltl]